ncbi:MAG: AAA family ATPase, partial [Caldilineaceae bacterium]|nr:AAA family ATPase [Caldilineaceae bacterium]
MPSNHLHPTDSPHAQHDDDGQAENPAAVDELLAYVPMDRRHALVRDIDLPDRTTGAALFADISGFTRLTEELVHALGPQRGVEELIQTINQVYAALIDRVHAYTGSVIAFAGDAITCWFDGDDGRRATSAALAMQQSMAMFVAVPTPTGNTVRLAMKASVAVGPVRRFLVGDPAARVIEAIAGATLTRLAHGEKLADAGEVLIDTAAQRAWPQADAVTVTRTAAEDGATFGVMPAGHPPAPSQPWPPLLTAGLRPAQVRPWLLPAIYQRLLQGLGTFLTELRPTVALFVRFAGIDYDGDDAAGVKLDQFIRRVQTVVARYDGTLIDLNIGDKGSYLYINFGAPFAHEDDAVRAVNAALDLRHSAAEFAYLSPLQMGISQGRMRAGAYGARSHRTYGVLGNEVNMAARLMMAATPGQILVSEEARRFLGEAFVLDEQPPRRLKGRDRPVVAYAVTARAVQAGVGIGLPATTLPMVGRRRELAQLREDLAGARTGRGAVVSLTGEAGLGKSRLIAEILRLATDRGFRIYAGEGTSYGVNSSYLAWQPIWRHLFAVPPDVEGDALAVHVQAKLAAVDPGLVRRAPLLAPVLNVALAENDLTRSLDARARKASLESLLLDCLRAEIEYAPMVLVLEDCQWLDPLSLDLLEVIGRALENLPVLLLLAYRERGQEQAHAARIEALPNHRTITLAPLTYAEAREFVSAKFGLTTADGAAVAPALVQRIVDQAEGNPFYIEELINYLLAREIDPTDPGALAKLELPSTLHNLVLSRVDQLSERQKIT